MQKDDFFTLHYSISIFTNTISVRGRSVASKILYLKDQTNKI